LESEEMGKPQTGLLLVNVGSPESPARADVRRFLREFLSDPDVLDIPPLLRWMILRLVILPFRTGRSARAYRKIWTDEGPPLLVHGLALTRKVRQRLGNDYEVVPAMRYGKPSIRGALESLSGRGIRRVVVLPMFPQYSAAVTGSTRTKVLAEVAELGDPFDIQFIPPFYDHPGFIEALASVARPCIERVAPEKIFLSFHGLPVRQVKAADDSGAHCLEKPDCCEAIDDSNRHCYRAQCFATARLLAERLEMPEDVWTVCFQSRLGRAAWIPPYTHDVQEREARRGVKRAVIISPSFVADCLETLHELGIEAVENWVRNGGELLEPVPALNASDSWADTVAAMARERG
jgi:ferrochelatase